MIDDSCLGPFPCTLIVSGSIDPVSEHYNTSTPDRKDSIHDPPAAYPYRLGLHYLTYALRQPL